jgi:hypothetical protein
MDALLGYGNGSDSEALDESTASSIGEALEEQGANEVEEDAENELVLPSPEKVEPQNVAPTTSYAEIPSAVRAPPQGSSDEGVATVEAALASPEPQALFKEISGTARLPSTPVPDASARFGDEAQSPFDDEVQTPVRAEAPLPSPPMSPPLSLLPLLPPSLLSPPPLLSTTPPLQPLLLAEEASRRLADDEAAGPWGDQLDGLGGSLNSALDAESLSMVKCPAAEYGEYGRLKVCGWVMG